MNNRNKLLVGCLALLLVLSVGYALFSETITINGTATAKGSFDITPTCQPGISNDILSVIAPDGGADANMGQGGYKNDSCTATGNSVTALVEFEYPTASRYFSVGFKNTGTIPASIDLKNGVIDSSSVCAKEKGASENCITSADLSLFRDEFYSYEIMGIKTATGTFITGDSAEWTNYVTNDDVVTLNANDTLIYILNLHWSDEDEGKDKEYTKTHLKLDFNFEQATN